MHARDSIPVSNESLKKKKKERKKNEADRVVKGKRVWRRYWLIKFEFSKRGKLKEIDWRGKQGSRLCVFVYV